MADLIQMPFGMGW